MKFKTLILILPILFEPFVFFTFADSTQVGISLSLSKILYVFCFIFYIFPYFTRFSFSKFTSYFYFVLGSNALFFIGLFYIFGFFTFFFNQLLSSPSSSLPHLIFSILDFWFRCIYILFAAYQVSIHAQTQRVFNWFFALNLLSIVIGVSSFVINLVTNSPYAILLYRQLSYYFSSNVAYSVGQRFHGLYGEPRDAFPALLLLAFSTFLYCDFYPISRLSFFVSRKSVLILSFFFLFLLLTKSMSILLTPLLLLLILIFFQLYRFIVSSSWYVPKSFIQATLLLSLSGILIYLSSAVILSVLRLERIEVYINSLLELASETTQYFDPFSKSLKFLSGQLPDLSVLFTLRTYFYSSSFQWIHFFIGHGPSSVLTHSKFFSNQLDFTIGLPFTDILRLIYDYGLIGFFLYCLPFFSLYKFFSYTSRLANIRLSFATTSFYFLLFASTLAHKSFSFFVAAFFIACISLGIHRISYTSPR